MSRENQTHHNPEAEVIYDLIDATEWDYQHILKHPELTSEEFLRFSKRIQELILSDVRISWSNTYHKEIPGAARDDLIFVGGTWLKSVWRREQRA